MYVIITHELFKKKYADDFLKAWTYDFTIASLLYHEACNAYSQPQFSLSVSSPLICV